MCTRFVGFLVSALLLVSSASAESPAAQPDDGPADNDTFFLTLYTAVIHGLYRDGVQKEVADWIVQGGPPRSDGQINTFFVYGCNLCAPVRTAIEHYADHKGLPFKSRKSWTLGPGLSQESIEKLHSETLQTRLDELNTYVQRWIGEGLDRLRLTDAEREEWEARIEHERELGLKRMQGQIKHAKENGQKSIYEEWTKCPSCDAAKGACTLPRTNSPAMLNPSVPATKP